MLTVQVQPFATEEETIAPANSTPYGLAAGLQTSDLARAHRVAARMDAGIVWVDDWTMLPSTGPAPSARPPPDGSSRRPGRGRHR